MSFKVAITNPRSDSFEYEREALDPIGAEIVPIYATTTPATPSESPTWTP